MEEQGRTVRAVSEDLERPYYRISYRLSLSGKELFTGALGGDLSPSPFSEDGFQPWASPIHPAGRPQRSRSEAAAPQTHGHTTELEQIESNIPGTPRTQHRRSCQPGFDPLNRSGEWGGARDEGSVYNGVVRDRRTRSVATSSEIEVHRNAPSIPIEQLQAQHENHRRHFAMSLQSESQAKKHTLQAAARSHDTISVQQGLVTCLNSKNVSKYKIGQSYKRGVIIGIDEEQGKIVVFHRSMPPGVLSVLRTKNSARYEKGYPVTDVQGKQLGTVHAVDRSQNILVINTATAIATPGGQQMTSHSERRVSKSSSRKDDDTALNIPQSPPPPVQREPGIAY